MLGHTAPMASPITAAAGERLYLKGVEIGVSTHDILEGHRFAVCEIKAGEDLRSWGISFGVALKDIHPGEYLCNVKVSSKREPRVPKDMIQLFLLENNRMSCCRVLQFSSLLSRQWLP